MKQQLVHMQQEKDQQKAWKKELQEEQRKRQDKFKAKLEGKYREAPGISTSPSKHPRAGFATVY